MPDRTPAPIFRVRELELRYQPHRLDSPFDGPLSGPAPAARFGSQVLRDVATEVVLLLHLNAKRRLIGVHRLLGSTNSVVINIAEIVRATLLSNARGLIMVHNHLSGYPEPSPEDKALAQKLHGALALFGLEFIDAVIVVDPAEGEQYYSFKEHGLL